MYTNGDACDILVNEGIGYAVLHYCDGKEFKDPMTALLWDEAGKALARLELYLKQDTRRDDF